MTEASAISTVHNVASAITASVRAGHLVPGQRLTENEFTRKLGVSRSSVREAFQRLTADGLLFFEPNRGVTVRQLSRAEVDNLFQIRSSLEALAVKLALPVLQEDPEALLAIQAEMDAAVDLVDVPRFAAANTTFHQLFTEAAHNPMLGEMLERLSNTVYWLQFRVYVSQREVATSNREHRKLVDAVLTGDANAAEAAILEHVETARELIQTLSDEHFARRREL